MMTWLKGFVRTRLLALVLAFITASFLLFPLFPISQHHPIAGWLIPVARAQGDIRPPIGDLLERTGQVFTDLLERTGLYTPPPKGTAPIGRRVGGAGRGPICALAENEPSNENKSRNRVKALIPFQAVNVEGNNQENPQIETRSNRELVGGLTIAAQPTFWFYVPYISTPETSPKRVAQFVLLDERDRPVWNELMAVELTDTPRIVEYPLSYSLEVGKLYNWYFSVICDSDKLSRNPVVRGWIQRAEPTPELQAALRNASRFEQYLAYANNGIWFDTVSSLVKIRHQFPDTYRGAWLSLLEYFQIPRVNQFDGLEPVEPIELEVVSGNQLPARM